MTLPGSGAIEALLCLAFGLFIGAVSALVVPHRHALWSHPAVAGRLRQRREVLDFLRSPWTAERMFVWQGLAGTLLLLTALVSRTTWPVLAVLLVALGPRVGMQRASESRRRAIEGQLLPFLRCLANALHASPSLAEGLRTAAGLLPGALSDEIQLSLRNHALGTPLSLALSDASRRIASPTVTGALLTMRLAQETGGDLPQVLRNTADALQEMLRLEGVIRTRTAEGRGQATLIGVMPLPLVLLVHQIDPGFFAPLRDTATGPLVAGLAGALWIAAALAARKILAVDI